MDDLGTKIARAIRQRVADGRTYGQLEIELGISRRTICHIVRGERGIGMQTFEAIRNANPSWLREVLSGKDRPPRGNNGAGPKGRPN